MAKGRKTGGRIKGTPNKVTAAVREQIEAFARQNAARLQELFDVVAAEDAAKALDLYLRAIEYHIPKLGRQEHVGEAGGAIQVVIQKLPPEGA